MASFLDQVGIWPYLLTILPYLLFLWVVFCHVYPVYRASQRGQRGQRTRAATLAGIPRILASADYPFWVLSVWFTATVGYLIICFIFALLASGVPSSRVNEVRAQLTECANRFRIQRCNDPNQPGWVCSFLERECWALAMCIASPTYLLVIQEILQEFGHQLWSTLYWFLFLVSLYILLCATFPDDVAVGAPPSPGLGPGPGPPPQIGTPVRGSPGLVPNDFEDLPRPPGPHVLPPSYDTDGFLPLQYLWDNDLFAEHLRRDEAHNEIRGGLRAAPNETRPDRMRDTRGVYFHVRRATDGSIVTRQEMNRILVRPFIPKPANENPVPDANGEGSAGVGGGTAQGPPHPALPSASTRPCSPNWSCQFHICSRTVSLRQPCALRKPIYKLKALFAFRC